MYKGMGRMKEIDSFIGNHYLFVLGSHKNVQITMYNVQRDGAIETNLFFSGKI
jgi:hypothetical protein